MLDIVADLEALQARPLPFQHELQPVVVAAVDERLEIDRQLVRRRDLPDLLPVQAVVVAEEDLDLAARANRGLEGRPAREFLAELEREKQKTSKRRKA